MSSNNGTLSYQYDYADGVSYAVLHVGNFATDVRVETKPIEEAIDAVDHRFRQATKQIAIMRALMAKWLAP